MSNLIKHLLIFAVVLIATPAFPEELEFDGGYIKTQSEDHIELKELPTYWIMIRETSKGFGGYFSGRGTRGYVASSNRQNMVTLLKDEFQGFVLKGRYDFSRFSLHPLTRQKLKRGEYIKRTNGPATKNRPFYEPGSTIETQGKSIGEDAYYWEPKKPLPKGEYVAWLRDSCWIFEIK